MMIKKAGDEGYVIDMNIKDNFVQDGAVVHACHTYCSIGRWRACFRHPCWRLPRRLFMWCTGPWVRFVHRTQAGWSLTSGEEMAGRKEAVVSVPPAPALISLHTPPKADG